MAGLSTIHGLIDRVNDFREQLETFALVNSCVDEKEKDIVQLNIDQLYDLGQNSLGVSLGAYAPMTVRLKQEKGQPYDRVTLRDTGDFHRGFYLRKTGEGFEITSSDDKTQLLMRDWGKSIFGLDDESMETLKQRIILPYILDKLYQIIYGNR